MLNLPAKRRPNVPMIVAQTVLGLAVSIFFIEFVGGLGWIASVL